jgi:hypothetical protein
MMIDGIKSFVAGLSTGHPALSAEVVYEFTERIVNPRHPRKKPVTSQPTEPRAARQQSEPAQQEVSRARAIFNASENLKPFDPADFDFAMTDDEPSAEGVSSALQESGSVGAVQRSKNRRILGMTPLQFAVIAALGLALMCILVTFAYLVFVTS